MSRRRAQVALALVALLVAFAIVEASLRTFVDRLPLALANDLASGYNTRRSGIYRYQPDMDMFLMRPHYEREMFFNGYHWHHRTDWMGFRNPEDRRSADVVLIGDSMVYGHGLEEESTIRHHLEALLGRSVANLGIQGAGIHEEYQVLKRFGLPLEPRFVFLFFLVNDIDDLETLHSDEEMRRFLATAVDDHRTAYFDVRGPNAGWFRPWKAVVGDVYAVRACRFLVHWLSPGGARAAEMAEPRWAALPLFRQRGPRHALAMRFHLHALAKIQDLARQGHFTFVNVFIWTGHFAEEPVYEGILKSYCREQGIAFLDLRDAEREVSDPERLFLPLDGHFSDAGTQWVAELLAKSMTG